MTRGKKVSIGAAIALALTAVACERAVPDIAREKATAKAIDRIAAGPGPYTKYCALCHGADAPGLRRRSRALAGVAQLPRERLDESTSRAASATGRPGTAMARLRPRPRWPARRRRDRRDHRLPAPRVTCARRLATHGAAGRGHRRAARPLYASHCQAVTATRTDARHRAVHLANPTFHPVGLRRVPAIRHRPRPARHADARVRRRLERAADRRRGGATAELGRPARAAAASSAGSAAASARW